MSAPGAIPGFGYTDTSVAAKLSLDIPGDSVDVLKNVAMYTADISANMSASARFGGEFMDYLNMFPQIQRQVLDMQKETLQVLRDSAAAMDQLKQSSTGYAGAGQGAPQQMGGGMSSQYYGAYVAPSSSDRDSTPRGTAGASSSAQDPNAGFRDSQVASYINATGAPLGYYAPQAGYNPGQAQPHQRVGSFHDNGMYRFTQGFGGIPIYGQAGAGAPNSPEAASDQSRHESEIRRLEIDRQAALRLRNATNGKFGNNPTGSPLLNPDGSPAGGTGEAEPHAGHSDRNSPTPKPKEEEGEGKKGGFMERLHGAMNTGAGLLGTGINTLGPDGTPVAGRIALGSKLLRGIGDLSPALKFAGAAGLGVGAAGLAFNAVQNIGEEMAGYKNMDVHGHNLSTGMGVQKDVMLMSLNPMISTEQSREIIMGALNSGRTGDAYTSAVDFVKKNLMDMNMGVAKSMEILTTNVEIGKASIESVKMDLSGLAQTAATGGKTQQAITDEYQKLSDLFVNTMGSQNGKGSAAAALFAKNFADAEDGTPNPLGGDTQKGTDLTAKLLQGSGFQSQLAGRYAPGTKPQNVVAKLGNDPKKFNEDMFGGSGILAQWAKEAQTSYPGDITEQKLLFFQRLQFMSGGSISEHDRGDVGILFDQLIKGIKTPEESIAGIESENQKKTDGSFINGKDASSMLTSDQWLQANPGKQLSDYYKATGLINPVNPRPGSVELLNKQKGGTVAGQIKQILDSKANVLALDPKGGKHYLDTGDAQQVIGLANGSWRLQDTGLATNGSMSHLNRDKNGAIVGGNDLVNLPNTKLVGPQVTLKDYVPHLDVSGLPSEPFTTTVNKDGSTSITASGNTSGGSVGGTFTVNIKMDPNTKGLVQAVVPGNLPNDANTIKANKGIGGATTNSAPPQPKPLAGRTR
jgi:hypothetical protein